MREMRQPNSDLVSGPLQRGLSRFTGIMVGLREDFVFTRLELCPAFFVWSFHALQRQISNEDSESSVPV